MKEAVKPTAELAEPETLLPATTGPTAVGEAINFEEDAGQGLDNVRGKDMAIPYYAILQKGSPQVDELNEKFIKDAKPGMIMNTVTGEVFERFDAIPCGFSKEFVEWKPRDSGGGFVGRHSENDPVLKKCTKDERGRMITPNNNVIMDTAYHFVVRLCPDGSFEWGIVGMQSTQLKKSRLWNTKMKSIMEEKANGGMFNPPSFSRIYSIKTVGESRDKYNWYGWEIEVKEKVKDTDLYNYAKEFARAVTSGSVQVSAPMSEEPAEGEDVPF